MTPDRLAALRAEKAAEQAHVAQGHAARAEYLNRARVQGRLDAAHALSYRQIADLCEVLRQRDAGMPFWKDSPHLRALPYAWWPEQWVAYLEGVADVARAI